MAIFADAGAVILLKRPRGCFGQPRDSIFLDGRTQADLPPGAPALGSTKAKQAKAEDRSITSRLHFPVGSPRNRDG